MCYPMLTILLSGVAQLESLNLRIKIMKQMKLWTLAAILTLCGTMNALAQIDPQVTEIMRKCEKVMSNPAGLEMTMTVIKIKFGVSDDIFKFDPKNYPNAVIIRK